MRKLNTNEKLLISFLIILLLGILLSWSDFSARLKKGISPWFSSPQQEQTR